MSRVVHVVPRDDAVEHDTSTEDVDCVCGPRWERYEYDDRPDGWAVVHASLDGREKRERERAEELTRHFGVGCDACDQTGVVCSDDGTGPGYGDCPPGHHGDTLHPWDGMSTRADACDHGGGAPCPHCSPAPDDEDGHP